MTVVQLDRLSRTAASEVKKQGWRGVMRSLAEAPSGLLVTNHDEPEAVILSTRMYQQLWSAFEREQRQQEAVLETLRREFDERLACFNEPDASDRLRAAFASPEPLRGRLLAAGK